MATKSETAVAKTIRLKKEAKAKLQRQSVKVDKTEQSRRAALRKKQVASSVRKTTTRRPAGISTKPGKTIKDGNQGLRKSVSNSGISAKKKTKR